MTICVAGKTGGMEINMEKWKIGWGVSNLCNMRCGFCYSKKTRQEPGYRENIQEGLRFILRNQERIDSINFGTGEPSLVPELFDLCSTIRREAPHISIGITTNGTLADAVKDPDHMDAFIRCIDDVDVSLDYGTAELQDRSRNYSGAFNMAVRTLALCREHGKNASIVNALHKYNGTISNMDALMRIARIYGASFRINIYRPTTDFDYVISYDRLKEIMVHLVRTYEIESLADPLFASAFGTPCPAGDPVARSSFRILPNGFISPSTYLLDSEWRVCRIDELQKIDDLHDYEGFQRILEAPVPAECEGCPVRESCRGGVIDRRWLWYHDLAQRDPYCPYRQGGYENLALLSGAPVCSKERKSFVHDGYLPTLIFSPRINERALDRWDVIYQGDIGFFDSSRPAGIAMEVLEAMPDHAGILDLGSGLGRNGLPFVKAGCRVTFTDSSKTACDRLWEKVWDEMPDADWRILDLDASSALRSLEDETMDGVLAVHVISHGSPEVIKEEYVRGIMRVLRKGGLAAVTLPSLNDSRCLNSPETEKGIKSFAFETGPEKGIVHSFYSGEAVRALFAGFRLRRITEVIEGGNAHWHLVVEK